MEVNEKITPQELTPAIRLVVELASEKTLRFDRRWNEPGCAPVITVNGRYTARSWTQWTQGLPVRERSALLELGGDAELLAIARRHVVDDMAEHLTHTGVHDHGFNTISTYGNLRRLMLAGRIERNEWELHFYELALRSATGRAASFGLSPRVSVKQSRPLRARAPPSATSPPAARRTGRVAAHLHGRAEAPAVARPMAESSPKSFGATARGTAARALIDRARIRRSGSGRQRQLKMRLGRQAHFLAHGEIGVELERDRLRGVARLDFARERRRRPRNRTPRPRRPP